MISRKKYLFKYYMSEGSGPNWWSTLKRLLGLIPKGGSGISAGSLTQPNTVPPDLNETYTASMSYLSSGAADFRESLGNPDFYYIDSSSYPPELREIDTSRIAVFKRAYNDGTVSIAFYDYGTNTLVYPKGVEFNSNVMRSPIRPGEYVIRDGGSTNGIAPNNAIWNGTSPLVAMGVMASSVTSSAGNNPAPDPRPEEKGYDTTALGKLVFRQMVGTSSVIYTGRIVVRQWQLEDGSYFANFYTEDGTELSVSTAQGSGAPDIYSMYKTMNVNGKMQRGLYLSAGGKDVFGFLDDNYSGSPPVRPPSINRSVILYDTSKLKFGLVSADGSAYTGSQFHVTWYYNPNNKNYQITFTDMDSKALSLQGQGLPPVLNGRYQMPWKSGETFQQQFESSFDGTPPTPGPPQPTPIPSGYRQLQGNSDSAWKFLRVKNRDGSRFTGQYYIQYQQQKFGNDYSLQVGNLTCFRVDQDGNKVYLNVDWGDVNFPSDGSNPIYDSSGNIVGEKYSMTLPGNTSGSGSLDQFLTQFYSSDNSYPEPPPTPPAELKKIEIQLQKGQTAIQAFNWNGHESTPAQNFVIHLEEQADGSYQVYATGGSSDPNSNIDGHLWVNLSTTGLRLNRLDNGNWEIPADIINRRLPPGATSEDIRHWFMDAYYAPPAPPDPTPDPVDPSKPKSMGKINSESFAVVWTQADGTSYDGDVQGYYVHARAGDGKQVAYFTDDQGNPLLASVPDGFTGWSPTLADAPAVHGRRLQQTGGAADSFEYDVPPGDDPNDPIDTYAEADDWFDNGFDVHGAPPPRPFGDTGLVVDGFVLYASEEEAFGVQDKIPDRLKDAGVIGFINYDGEYKKKEKRYGFTPLDPTSDPLGLGIPSPSPSQGMPTEPIEEKEPAEGAAAVEPTPEPSMFESERFPSPEATLEDKFTFTSSGGEYCQEGAGRGRRLMACGPEETPDPASHARSEERESVVRELPRLTTSTKNAALERVREQLGKPSNMDLLNLEYQDRHRYDPKRGFFGAEGDLGQVTEYDDMLHSTDEKDLVSMYATFSDASYVDDEHRPQSLFGLNYKRDDSSNNFAVYTAPGGTQTRQMVISVRGTKPSNVIDLMSDALILTGYEDKLSVRFNEDLIRVKSLLDKYPAAKVTLSSHSLGGAINEYIINELKGTPYEGRVKAVSFNPGKAPNTKSERSDQIKEFITDASVLKALKTGDPRYLPVMGSIQRTLNISAADLAGGNLGTLSESQLAQYPALSRSYQQMLGNLRGAETIAERESIAQGWIGSNREFLEGGVNVSGSITNLIKTKIYLDLAIAMFDWSANYSYDQIYKRESSLDQRMKNTRNPYDVMFKEGDNAIFKYNSDPISVHHSLLDNEARNVRTYFQSSQEKERPSLLQEGLLGQLSYGLKSHGIDNFMSKKDKARVNHDETVFESFKNILDDNVESLSGVLNGLKRKGRQELTEFVEGIFKN